jgi:pyruvate formate lyase activating enzyme
MLDTFVLARKKGLRTLLHTNGALQAVSLKKLLEYTDAVCVDLKGFTQKAYQNSAATLEPVLQNLKTIKEQGRWLEVVNLIVPTINDDPADITRMCQWIKENLGVETPLHLSRFFPSYKLTHLPPTPIKVLEQARKIATDAGLHYVIIGNVPGHVSNSTFCPKCGKPLISRVYFEVTKNDLQDGTCRFCGHKVPGIWK